MSEQVNQQVNQPADELATVLTAAEADIRASGFSGWLADSGAGAVLEPGDRLLLAVPTKLPTAAADLICAVLGALRAGVVPVVVDPVTPAAELAEIAADCTPALTLSGPAQLAAAVRASRPGAASLAPPLGRAMHYTSGTTGRRKGVASGVLSRQQAEALWDEEIELWSMGPGDRHLVMSPLYHSAPLRFAVATLLAGGEVLLAGDFEVARFLAAARSRPTTAFTAPAQLARLREHARTRPAAAAAVAAALGGFRLIAHAGAPCPEQVKRWLIDLVGADRVWEFYGSTEGQFTACSGREWLARPGTVGQARPGRSLQLDDDGTIWCTVPDFARFSYWGADEKTRAAWRETATGPAFTVGDAGSLDGDGYLYLNGRRDDLIISGGVNVYPAEVERVLGELDGVLEIAVFGVPDDRWGQRVEAAVRGPISPDDVIAAAARSLPPARRPKRVHIVDQLPRTATGKILRRELPELLGSRGPGVTA